MNGVQKGPKRSDVIYGWFHRSYDVEKWPIYSNGIILKGVGAGSFCYVHFSARLWHKDYRCDLTRFHNFQKENDVQVHSDIFFDSLPYSFIDPYLSKKIMIFFSEKCNFFTVIVKFLRKNRPN